MDGDSASVTKAYQDDFLNRVAGELSVEELRRHGFGSGEIIIERVTLHNADDQECDEFYYGDELVVRLHYLALRPVENPMFITGIMAQGRFLLGANMLLDGLAPERLDPGRGVVECRFLDLPLLPSVYQVLAFIKLNLTTNASNRRIMATFRVVGDLGNYGWNTKIAQIHAREGYTIVPYQWRLKVNGQVLHLGEVRPKRSTDTYANRPMDKTEISG